MWSLCYETTIMCSWCHFPTKKKNLLYKIISLLFLSNSQIVQWNGFNLFLSVPEEIILNCFFFCSVILESWLQTSIQLEVMWYFTLKKIHIISSSCFMSLCQDTYFVTSLYILKVEKVTVLGIVLWVAKDEDRFL